MSDYNVGVPGTSHTEAVVGGEAPSQKTHFLLKTVTASLVIVVALTGFLLFKGQSGSPAGEVGLTGRNASVTITDEGFLPAELRISPGTTVTWVNNTGGAHQVGANPYPSHSTLPELFSGVLSPHQSYSFVFYKTGTWLYQDDNSPLHSGSIIVK